MKVLVANLGSTSFKYRLFDMPAETQLARGGVTDIGSGESVCTVEIGDFRSELTSSIADQAAALKNCLDDLAHPEHGCLKDPSEVAAVGFKAVHGGRLSGVQFVDDEVLEAMSEMNHVAPAHNPPYIAAMRLMRERLPQVPLVAAFETDFHRTIPRRNCTYGIPRQWDEEFQIRRWGFHGASHRFIATRISEILGREDLRLISCHLGGSSSITAIRNGKSVATSMGVSPQSGLIQNNRVGDFDPFALPLIMERTGLSLESVLQQLATKGGLYGIGGHNDLRTLQSGGTPLLGAENAKLAVDTFVSNVRQYMGWMLVELGGADVIVFTGGIGENGCEIRTSVCRDLGELGIELDVDSNNAVKGEAKISSEQSRVQIWVVPTKEELVVARQVYEKLQGGPSA